MRELAARGSWLVAQVHSQASRASGSAKKRYRSEAPAMLRLPTTALLESTLNFSRYNSGAPRCSGGKYSPRGARTYLPASEFVGTASEVVEVVAIGACSLPRSVEVSLSPTGLKASSRTSLTPPASAGTLARTLTGYHLLRYTQAVPENGTIHP